MNPYIKRGYSDCGYSPRPKVQEYIVVGHDEAGKMRYVGGFCSQTGVILWTDYLEDARRYTQGIAEKIVNDQIQAIGFLAV